MAVNAAKSEKTNIQITNWSYRKRILYPKLQVENTLSDITGRETLIRDFFDWKCFGFSTIF